MIYHIGEMSYRDFLVLLPNNFNCTEFINYAKVKPNSYLGRVFERYYDFLTMNTFCLQTEYENYYQNEYKSYKNYLLKRFPVLSGSDVEEIITYTEQKSHRLYKNISENLSDYTVQQLFDYGEDFSEKICTLLKEVYNES